MKGEVKDREDPERSNVFLIRPSKERRVEQGLDN